MMTKTKNISRIGLLATGNELTEGDILNTNSQEIAKRLADQGLAIGLHVTVSDAEEDMREALYFLLKSHNVIIITGGLGPTSDDRTRYALSAVVKQELVFDEASWQAICELAQQRLGREPHPANRQQALFPEGSAVIPNPKGTAAGCKVGYDHKIIYMLPGPPHECLPMFEEWVLPDILSTQVVSKKIKLSWRLQGAVESDMAALLDEALSRYPVTTGYRAHSPYLEVKVYTEHHAQFDEMLLVIKNIIDPYLVPE